MVLVADHEPQLPVYIWHRAFVAYYSPRLFTHILSSLCISFLLKKHSLLITSSIDVFCKYTGPLSVPISLSPNFMLMSGFSFPPTTKVCVPEF